MRRSTPAVLLAVLSTLHGTAAAQSVAPPGPLTLLGAIRLGRAQGVSAAIARKNAMIGRERAVEKFGEFLPSLTASTTASRQTTNLDEFGIPTATGVTDPFSVFKSELGLTQTLFDPAAWARFRAAKDEAIGGAQDARAAGQFAGAAAGLAWLRAQGAVETVRAREADSAIAWRLLDQARQLVAAGVSPSIDATRSEVSFTAVLTQLEVARNERDRTRLDLLRALDLPATSPLAIADSADECDTVLPAHPDSAAAIARMARIDLAAARSRSAAARRSRQAIRFEGLPSIKAGASIATSGNDTGSLESSYRLQLGISVPLFDGFKRQRRASAQAIQADIRAIEERDLAERVDVEARQATLDLVSAGEQVRIADRRVRLAERELREAEARFAAGVAGSVETTNAQASLIAARDALIQARLNLGSARVAAYRALGLIDRVVAPEGSAPGAPLRRPAGS